jgi:hypothetical protein
MLNYKKLTAIFSSLALAALFGVPAFGQQQADRPRRTGEQGRNEYGVEQAPDLTQENLGRVAASSIQIRAVLVKDEGLMVELKRWVAKEATDSGQVVEDSNLTDQAIFERLDQDVAFRSVATRLLQRYGYLTPTPNPDSDFAKEKELVLKERARRLVQIESQEDSEAFRPQRNDRDLERTATCDPRRDEDCPQPSPVDRSQKTRSPRRISSPDANPQPLPEQGPSQSPSRILRADGLPQATDPLDGTGGAGSSLNLQLASESVKRDTNPLGGVQALDQGAIDGSPLGRDARSLPNAPGRGEVGPASDKNGMERASRIRPAIDTANEEALSPVRMVHRANPYADIPSLYDMYVQASAHQRPNERFGMEVFRNSANDPEAIPMDLPVGPDYVLGPGDSIEIDLWGGVSQRMFRIVDREGRVTLPEAGPLLVSGRNLGEVQLAVQQVLRTEYRDVSADVSLSKLRTVRVYVVGDVAQPGAYDISSL